MTDEKVKLLNMIADLEVLLAKGRYTLAKEMLAKLKKEIEQ